MNSVLYIHGFASSPQSQKLVALTRVINGEIELNAPDMNVPSFERLDFEAMVKLGELNSRMKDFYDIWLLSRQFDFDGSRLAEAIKLTFNHRGTPISEMVPAFTKAFATAKQAQWAAFHKRLQQDNVPLSFADVVTLVDEFLSPVISSIVTSTKTPARWTASGSWLKGRLSESNG